MYLYGFGWADKQYQMTRSKWEYWYWGEVPCLHLGTSLVLTLTQEPSFSVSLRPHHQVHCSSIHLNCNLNTITKLSSIFALELHKFVLATFYNLAGPQRSSSAVHPHYRKLPFSERKNCKNLECFPPPSQFIVRLQINCSWLKVLFKSNKTEQNGWKPTKIVESQPGRKCGRDEPMQKRQVRSASPQSQGPASDFV